MKQILMRTCNVKKVVETSALPKGNFAQKQFGETEVFLELQTDKKLKEEWERTELRRTIQEQRKQQNFSPNQKITLFIDSADKKFLKKFKKQLERETNTKILLFKKTGKMEKILEREFFIELKAKN
ncbi:MAG: hypothetical protein HYW50_01760 [Candidatus Diapherotrites archaeon]|nr:hypothetical protein [Candidatus Diapherotrites archaeon]